MARLSEARIAQYARSMASARDGFHFDMFRPLAVGDGVREEDLQQNLKEPTACT